MAHQIETVPLMISSPGAQRALKVHRIGGRTGPRAYIQAALHANETPGLLIAHHLLDLMLAADRAGRVVGELVLVPYANPIGLADNVLGNQVGREALDGGGNYNRGWPNLSPLVTRKVDGRIGEDTGANVATIRSALHEALDEQRPATEVQFLQIALLKLAIGADVVIDVHTELVAVAGMVVNPWSLPMIEPLVGEIDPVLVHVTDTPLLFDSVCSRPWHDLAAIHGRDAVPQATISATIEMRGVTDVDHATARRDAEAIFRYLVRVGVVTGDSLPAPVWPGEMTPHEAIAMIRTPVAGVIVYPHGIGAHVEAGAVVAEIVDPAADDPAAARTPIVTPRPCLVYAGVLNRLVRPNDIVVKIAATDFARPVVF